MTTLTQSDVTASPHGSFPEQSLVHAGRLLRRWRREPEIMVQSLVFPTALLLMYQLVLGRFLTASAGHASIDGFVPLVAVTATMFGAMATGTSLHAEAESGLLDRWQVLPGYRAVVPAGRLLAECGRTLCATVLLLAVGAALGLRWHRGIWCAICAVGVPTLLVVGFATMVMALAVSPAGSKIVELCSILILLGMFFNSGFVPVDQYPGWLQPVVRYQPMSVAIDAMRGLVSGGPVALPLLYTAVWSLGLTVVFGRGVIRGYRV
ncbi:ABC transporter permease [Nocardia alni]|uniref:ABC transporter permease n=1 Tax=Nocardia alni TaxID=2815723 RepID=UPI001C251071|nr:ABC transporter permease [Nocardia alni]